MEPEISSSTTPKVYDSLKKNLISFRNFADLARKIVNSPFNSQLLATNIDLGIVVLLLVNPETKTIDRVALSNTELAKNAVKVSAKQFHEIKIPINAPSNIISKVIKTHEFKITTDWDCLFHPVLSAKEARLNQANAGIECSLVYPLLSGNGGALIYSFYQPQEKITDEHLDFVSTYSMMVDDALNRFLKNKK